MKKVTALILTILVMISIVPTSVYASEMSMCLHCYGSGTTYGTGYETCDECHGRGYTGDYYQMVMCEKCNGTGEMRKRITCEFCKGTGDVLAYTVYYDPNWGINAPSKQKKYAGEPLYLSKQLPIWDWGDDIRVFAGWSTTALGEAEYQPGDKYDIDADITLYAVWKKASVITYDANGGTGAPPSQAVEQGKTVYLSRNIPTRSGYKFSGWSTTASGDTIYNPGDPYTLNSDITLYAVWLPNNDGYTYTIENGQATIIDYDDGGERHQNLIIPNTLGGYPVVCIGDHAFEECSISYVTIPESVTSIGTKAFNKCVYLMSVILPKEGLISIGDGAFRDCWWLDTITIPKTVVDIGIGILTYAADDLLVGCYAHSAGYKYVIENDINYRIVPEFDISQTNIELIEGENGRVTLITSGIESQDLNTIIWTSSNPSVASISESGTTTKEIIGNSLGEATITAKIEIDDYPFTMETSCKVIVKDSYKINYCSDGVVSGMPSEQIKRHDEPLELSTLAPKRSQYTFKGWSTEPNDTTVEYQRGNTYTENADITLYAVWEWTPICGTCKGEGEVKNSCSVCGGDGDVIKKTTLLCTTCNGQGSWEITYVEKEEHTCPICHGELVTWSSSSNSWVPCKFCNGLGVVTVDVEKTKIEKCSTCQGTGERVYTSTVPCQSCSGLGYFINQCTQCKGKGVVDRQTYTITYDVNGGTGAPNTQIKEQGLAMTLNKNIPVKSGYVFCGWETHMGDTTIVYQPGDNYIADGDNTLIAIWKELEPIPGYSCGDIDNNGTINLKDVTQLQKYLAGWDVEVATEYCDVNADGEINLKDVTHLQKYLAGWEVELGQS